MPSPAFVVPHVCRFVLLASLAGIVLLPHAVRADEVLTLDGSREVEIQGIEAKGGALSFRTSAGPLDAREVREVRFALVPTPKGKSPARVFLRTGEELPGRLEAGSEETVALLSPTLGRLSLRFEHVAGVALTDSVDDLERFRREVVRAKPADSDEAVLASWERKPGTLEAVTDKGFEIELDGLGKVSLDSTKAIGVRLTPLGAAPALPAGTAVRLTLACGGTVRGALKGLTRAAIELATVYGPSVRVPLADVELLAVEGGRFVYVSDLEPAQVEERSDVIGFVLPHKRDLSVTGVPLRVGDRVYRKGLGMKAYTRLRYETGGKYARLRAVIGLDDSARARADVLGTARFQVLVDGVPKLDPKGLLLTSDDAPQAIDLDVSSAKVVELVCDFGPSRDVLARGAFADAYFVMP